MFLGDSVITPAISVLSAVEGLELAAPGMKHYVLPLTIVILLVLFAVQRRGTARVASYFGPVMLVWFITIAVAGAMHIRDDLAVFAAINPIYAITFVSTHGHIGLIALGAVFLAVTGGEALYADLGHFGRKPIQRAWLGLVLPALLINYFGQGALVLAHPETIENPFYRLVPEALLLPLIVLATAATVIASQAVITGAYSLVRQAIQLGLLPRLAIVHTSAEYSGQIYLPRVNTALLVGVMLLVGLFHTSSALASAYGIAVATTMVVDGVLGFIVIWKLWRWPVWKAAGLMVPLVIVDATFFSANLLKLLEGAWVPLLFGIFMVMLILTWRRGTRILANKTRKTEVPLEALLHSLEKRPPHIVPGTAVFLTSDPEFAPTALLHNLKHNKVLHEQNVILTIITEDTPRAREEERVTLAPVSQHFMRVALRFGYNGDAQRAEGTCHCAQAGLALRHHVDVVLPVAAGAEAGGAFRHAALAGPAVHRIGQERLRCHRLFPDPDRARGGDRHPSYRLTSRCEITARRDGSARCCIRSRRNGSLRHVRTPRPAGPRSDPGGRRPRHHRGQGAAGRCARTERDRTRALSRGGDRAAVELRSG